MSSETIVACEPLKSPDLCNRSILITGGASGLGLGTVRAVASAGAYVTIATNVAVQDDILQSLKSDGSHVQEVICDVSRWNSLLKAFKAAVAFSPSGTLDAVAIFAGVDHFETTFLDVVVQNDVNSDPGPPAIDEIEANLKGAIYTTALALHYMRLPTKEASSARPEGKSITYVSSLAGYIDDWHNPIYSASKFGMRGLWRSTRARIQQELGVRCNLIAPWAVVTPLTKPILEKMERLGLRGGKGITFADEQTVVQAAVRSIADAEMTGRALAVVPEGFFDIADDIDGAYAGTALQQLMRLRKEAGDYLHG